MRVDQSLLGSVDEMARVVQSFEVSLKAFVLNGDKALFLKERDTGLWELPGGRIDVGEEMHAHSEILAREMTEELGVGMTVDFGDATVSWTRAHPEGGPWVFLIARVGRLVAGAPVLSDEHDGLVWASIETWRDLRFPPHSGYVNGISALWRIVGQN